MDRRRSITLIPATSIAVVLLAATPASAAATWAVMPNQAVGVQSSLGDVDALSASDAWAVGHNDSDGLIERWNGTRWAVSPSPTIVQPGNSFAGLGGVDALSSTLAFAVGSSSHYGDDGLLHTSAVALRWNGTSWSRSQTPASSAIVNSYAGVKAFSATDAWTVGRTVPSVDGRTLTAHWNGSAWATVASPSPSTRDNLLVAVDGRAANDLWAVGYYRDPPYGNPAQHSLILHWNGTAWTRVASPDVGTIQTRLRDVVAISATDAWAVGSTNVNTVGANDSSAVLHWNGTAWSKVTPPALASLWSVAALSSTDIWVAGNDANGVPHLANWRGSSWTITVAPGATSTATTSLSGLTALSPSTVWGVGQLTTSADGSSKPLTIRTTNG